MNEANIREVLIHGSLGLCVIPNLPTTRDYQFIYRAAQSVRWNDELRSLYLLPVKDWSYVDAFRSIIAAVAGEYGDLLRVDGNTIWTAVPGWVRSEIQALSDLSRKIPD